MRRISGAGLARHASPLTTSPKHIPRNQRETSAVRLILIARVDWRLGFGADRSARAFWLTGAGEGIRTLDPNLGKVVLYP